MGVGIEKSEQELYTGWVENVDGVVTIEQATEVGQLLTKPDTNFADKFVVGGVARMEEGRLPGKESMVAEVRRLLDEHGVVVIEGGYRSGKSSVLRAVGDGLERDSVVGGVVDTEIFAGKNDPQEVKTMFGEALSYCDGKKVAIMVDELEYLDEDEQMALLEEINRARAEGHKVVISVIGDLRSSSSAELSRSVKERILEMAGDSVVINRLLIDDEMRDLLTPDGENLFTEPMLGYLIREAGGSPFLGNALALASGELLTIGGVEPSSLKEELRRSDTVSGSLSNFAKAVDTVVAVGFDPLTWEWHGEGEPPDVEVYRNMLPRGTSTIFRNWLGGYLKSRK